MQTWKLLDNTSCLSDLQSEVKQFCKKPIHVSLTHQTHLSADHLRTDITFYPAILPSKALSMKIIITIKKKLASTIGILIILSPHLNICHFRLATSNAETYAEKRIIYFKFRDCYILVYGIVFSCSCNISKHHSLVSQLITDQNIQIYIWLPISGIYTNSNNKK